MHQPLLTAKPLSVARSSVLATASPAMAGPRGPSQALVDRHLDGNSKERIEMIPQAPVPPPPEIPAYQLVQAMSESANAVAHAHRTREEIERAIGRTAIQGTHQPF